MLLCHLSAPVILVALRLLIDEQSHWGFAVTEKQCMALALLTLVTVVTSDAQPSSTYTQLTA